MKTVTSLNNQWYLCFIKCLENSLYINLRSVLNCICRFKSEFKKFSLNSYPNVRMHVVTEKALLILLFNTGTCAEISICLSYKKLNAYIFCSYCIFIIISL